MKQKGFTLIELLAVILILGIITVIAIPTVSKIIDESKREAFKTSAYNIVSAMEDACQLQILKGETPTSFYTFTEDGVTPSLKLKGKLPTSGIATVDSNCKVAFEVTNKTFAASKLSSTDIVNVINIKGYSVNLLLNGDDNITKYVGTGAYVDLGATAQDIFGNDLTSSIETVVKKEGTTFETISTDTPATYTLTYSVTSYGHTYSKSRTVTVENRVYANGTAVYFNPVTGIKCTEGQAVSITGTKTGCMKWYTFNDGGSTTDTINLILDHNTTAVVAWNSSGNNVSGPINVLTQLQTDTSSWAGVQTRTDSYSLSNGAATYTINYSTYKARLISASEIAEITDNSSFFEAITPYTSWFYLDSNNQTQIATTTGASNYDWLFDYTNGCTSYGCNISDASNYGYWTSTAVSGNTNNAWFVRRSGTLYSGNVDYAALCGVRPVITISKSVFE